MLLAPINPGFLHEPRSRERIAWHAHARPRPAADRGPPAAALLGIWIMLGLCVLACVPAARGNVQFGASLPFWLVIAPAIDLLWLTRRHWSTRMRGILRYRRGVLPAQAQRSGACSRRCRADRSSRK